MRCRGCFLEAREDEIKVPRISHVICGSPSWVGGEGGIPA